MHESDSTITRFGLPACAPVGRRKKNVQQNNCLLPKIFAMRKRFASWVVGEFLGEHWNAMRQSIRSSEHANLFPVHIHKQWEIKYNIWRQGLPCVRSGRILPLDIHLATKSPSMYRLNVLFCILKFTDRETTSRTTIFGRRVCGIFSISPLLSTQETQWPHKWHAKK